MPTSLGSGPGTHEVAFNRLRDCLHHCLLSMYMPHACPFFILLPSISFTSVIWAQHERLTTIEAMSCDFHLISLIPAALQTQKFQVTPRSPASKYLLLVAHNRHWRCRFPHRQPWIFTSSYTSLQATITLARTSLSMLLLLSSLNNSWLSSLRFQRRNIQPVPGISTCLSHCAQILRLPRLFS